MSQEVVYLETVDNEIQKVDTEHKLFMGFVEDDDYASRQELEKQARERFQKEQSVKPK